MLKPSYAELMDIMNKDNESGSDITSRYTVVIAAAKRARQIIMGDTPMVEDPDIEDKPLSLAVEEMEKGKIKVVPEGMGTKLHIEEDSLKEEIRSDLEKAATEAREENVDHDHESVFEDVDPEEDLSEDNLSEEELDDLDVLDFEEE